MAAAPPVYQCSFGGAQVRLFLVMKKGKVGDLSGSELPAIPPLAV